MSLNNYVYSINGNYEKSYPYHGGKEGCRIDTKGNCKPGSYNGYTYYQVK